MVAPIRAWMSGADASHDAFFSWNTIRGEVPARRGAPKRGDSAEGAHAPLSGRSASVSVIHAKDLGFVVASALIADASRHRGLG